MVISFWGAAINKFPEAAIRISGSRSARPWCIELAKGRLLHL